MFHSRDSQRNSCFEIDDLVPRNRVAVDGGGVQMVGGATLAVVYSSIREAAKECALAAMVRVFVYVHAIAPIIVH